MSRFEALAMGLYVVTSRFNGGKEVLTPQSGSVIEELTSPESVAQALKTALAFPKIFYVQLKLDRVLKTWTFPINYIKL